MESGRFVVSRPAARVSLDTYAWECAKHSYMETFSEQVGANIRAELARQKKTQAQLADVWGLNQASVSKRMAGTVPVAVTEVAKVADWLGVPMSRLMGDTAA